MTTKFTHKAIFRSVLLILVISNLSSFGQEQDEKSMENNYYTVGLRYTLLLPSGQATIISDGTEVDSEFPESGTNPVAHSPSIAVGIQLGKYHLSLGANPVSYKIQGEVPNNVFENGNFIPEGTPTYTETEMYIFSLIATRKVISGKHSEFGIGLGLMLINYSSTLNIEGVDEEAMFEQWFPAPMLALRYVYDIKHWEFDAVVGGVGVKINSSAIAYMDFEAAARYKMFRKNNWMGMISLGIKYIPFYISTEQEDFSFEQTTNFVGPYLGLRFKFF